ncbi:hypothetical protein J7E50_12720 [Pedobacter sp. ISL-68]|uniref:RHS repeat domain-containing protein n=1 Tax=unclassified Pedobacter TaxID=2628915 RepID=UPI001BE656FB|nr:MULTISPECIES: RHS repeat domain-containing protein [unclassified Pedobacter]MBT2561700.1 hypothetical protein [Pedobacter sp. ISL-64]MBT2591088.1 hypothetical protein [Pedobacter sp. ISL-68]
MKSHILNGSALLKQGAILLICLLCNLLVSAQGQPNPPSIVGQLPTISPPSPTVAALMKFEEVSVNHYTGIPDVSIPLYSVGTLSPDINMDISLKYHPSSIAVEEVAGYTGLGWSIFSGGSVARTVKGAPDEESEPGDTGRIGILQDNPDPSGNYGINRYNEVLALLGTSVTPEQSTMIGEYGWGVAQNGKFDTQHDLWQYNFMGHTGRFFIKRDFTTGQLVPVKLDNDNAMTITLDYSQSAYDYYRHRYEIEFNGFTLHDDRGYKYVFTAKEMTEERNAYATYAYAGLGNVGPITTPLLSYASAFNLTEIWDNNDKLLVSISYIDTQEVVQRHTESVNYITAPTSALALIQDPAVIIYGLPASQTTSTISTDVMTKKIATIEVINKARITFDTGFGRADTNVNAVNGDAPYLNSMTVRNWYGELIKQYNFTYDYATLGPEITRMILSSVINKNTLNNGEELTYSLSYKNQNAPKGTKDYWGYYSRRQAGGREPDELECTANILEKMILPTGGSIVFNYGPNTYSFIGSEPVTDFSIDNPYEEPLVVQVPGEGEVGIFPAPPTMPTEVFFVTTSPVPGGKFYVRADNTQAMHSIDALGDNGLNDGTGVSDSFTMEANVKYYVGYKVPGGIPGSYTGTVQVYKNQTLTTFGAGGNAEDHQWLMGGGIRINSISYNTDDATSQSPKVKLYSYQSFANPNISSGSLAFAKPLFKFYTGKTCYYENTTAGPNPSPGDHFNISYTTTTSHNNLAYIRTKGSDVGYKNITVSETGNGKSEYTYTTPIDYPGIYEVTPPFRPLPNDDYKRGLLLKVRHYAETKVNDSVVSYKPLLEDTYVYPPEGEMNDQAITTGYAMDPSSSWAAPQYGTYSAFKNCVDNHCLETFGDEEWHFLSLGLEVQELFGWPQLKEKISKEYFYPEGGTTAKTVTTTETYQYNYNNKKLSESSKTNSLNEVLKTKYIYDTNSNARNRIGMIKRIESKRNNQITDTKDITYSKADWGSANNSFLPKTIFEAKGVNTLQSSINIKKYDVYSNPVEASQENGATMCYIWGYNSSQPIALIENITYSTLTSNPTLQTYINNAVTASNNNDTVTLLDNLEALRSALPASATMTGYSYKPLVGVTTIIDPRGKRETFYYDGFGRLKEVRDSQGNLLSENEYYYKNQ